MSKAIRRRSSQQSINATQPIDVIFGAFDIGSYRVPYASAVLRLWQVAEYLNLVTDDGKYATLDWEIEELFQREIDHARVVEMSETYLDPNSPWPKFFNSITVVLSPKEGKDAFAPPPPIERDGDESVCKGPITLVGEKPIDGADFPAAGTFGSLSWNREQVSAVAIDGQHRLAALKEFARTHGGESKETTLSVLFLLLEPEFGLRPTEGGEEERRVLMRRIFVDLNKRTVPVSQTRNLLLDDYDPQALFVRSLVGTRLTYRPTGKTGAGKFLIGEDQEFLTCVPLEAVDWQSDTNAKIDQGPYVASLWGIKWIVEKLLSKRAKPHKPLVPERFSLEEEDTDDGYKKIEKLLQCWKGTWSQHGLAEAINEARNDAQPFALSKNQLAGLCDEFLNDWGQIVTSLLVSLRPYRRVIKQRLDEQTFNATFGQWYQAFRAKERADRSQNIAVREHFKDRFERVEKELKSKDVPLGKYKALLGRIETVKVNNLMFQTVGQKALFLAFLRLTHESIPDLALAGGFTDKYVKSKEQNPGLLRVEYLVNALDWLAKQDTKGGLFDKNLKVDGKSKSKALNRSFWAASLLSPSGDKIDKSEKAAARAEAWLRIGAHLYYSRKLDWSSLSEDEFQRKVLAGVGDASARRQVPKATQLLFKAIDDVTGRSRESLFNGAHTDYAMAYLAKSMGSESKASSVDACVARLEVLIKLADEGLADEHLGSSQPGKRARTAKSATTKGETNKPATKKPAAKKTAAKKPATKMPTAKKVGVKKVGAKKSF